MDIPIDPMEPLAHTCDHCESTGDCLTCNGNALGDGWLYTECSECGGMASYAGLACGTCDGRGQSLVLCASCKGTSYCPRCLDQHLRCPVCGGMVKWSCHGDTGVAQCENGRMVSRQLPGDTEIPCPWRGGRVIRVGRSRVRADLNDEAWLG